MTVTIHEDKCPSCRCYVKEGAEACPHCGATWEVPK